MATFRVSWRLLAHGEYEIEALTPDGAAEAMREGLRGAQRNVPMPKGVDFKRVSASDSVAVSVDAVVRGDHQAQMPLTTAGLETQRAAARLAAAVRGEILKYDDLLADRGDVGDVLRGILREVSRDGDLSGVTDEEALAAVQRVARRRELDAEGAALLREMDAVAGAVARGRVSYDSGESPAE